MSERLHCPCVQKRSEGLLKQLMLCRLFGMLDILVHSPLAAIGTKEYSLAR